MVYQVLLILLHSVIIISSSISYPFNLQEENFSIYTTYCTNYPEAVKVLTECANNEVISGYFREIQWSLGHGLPLGAYLLKPVQRILKYHLLFQVSPDPSSN